MSSQHNEDQVLADLFAELGQESGTYLDVGAWHPYNMSNTWAFYERGWRGILVEPGLEMYRLLCEYRPEDEIHCAACSDEDGEAVLYECGGGCLSTLEEGEAAKRHGEGVPVTGRTVPVRTVKNIVGGRPAPDLFSLDVEGHELQVLRGCPFSEGWRPKVIIIEAFRPRTTEPSHEVWEHILLDSGYKYHSTCEINRIYVS